MRRTESGRDPAKQPERGEHLVRIPRLRTIARCSPRSGPERPRRWRRAPADMPPGDASVPRSGCTPNRADSDPRPSGARLQRRGRWIAKSDQARGSEGIGSRCTLRARGLDRMRPPWPRRRKCVKLQPNLNRRSCLSRAHRERLQMHPRQCPAFGSSTRPPSAWLERHLHRYALRHAMPLQAVRC